jgi:hypothetical protein
VTPSYVAVASLHVQINYSPRKDAYQLVLIRDDGEATEHFFSGPITLDQGLWPFASDALDQCVYGAGTRVIAHSEGLVSL